MDRLGIFGLFLAIVAILGGQLLDGGSLSALYNGPALVIVLGGTLGAVILQTPIKNFTQGLKITHWLIWPPQHDFEAGIQHLMAWSNIARREGLLGLEKLNEEITEPFLEKAMGMLIDGNDANAIRESMLLEIETREHQQLMAARTYDAMGGYSPTMGIIGAVLGLIHVMKNLSSPDMLGAGIATAFVATIYGVGFANLIFIPFGNKIRNIVMEQSQYRMMLLEGLVAIAEGENPKVIEKKLNGFIH